MEMGEVSAAITTIKFYLAQDLGVIQFLAEASVIILKKTRCKNNTVGYFQKLLVVAAFRTGDSLGAGKSCHCRSSFFSFDLGCIRITHYERNPPFGMIRYSIRQWHLIVNTCGGIA
jgi:hypothetical protein